MSGAAGSREIPLSPEAVDGWRAWSVVRDEGGLRLSSLTRAEAWPPGEPLLATCARRAHEPAARGCRCGVYAATGPEGLAGLGRIAGGAIGQVSLWGRIVEHSHGYRAGIAYPARLRLVCTVCLGRGSGVAATRLDEDRSTDRVRIVPLCEEHADGRPLPPSASVEAALLSTYRVDLVPGGSLERIAAGSAARLRARRSRRGWAAAMAAVIVTAIAISATALRDPPPPPRAAHAPIASPGAEVYDGVKLPLDRTSDGLVLTPRIRLLLLTPEELGEPRCGRLTSTGVVAETCADPDADVFVESVGPLGSRGRTCRPTSTAVTRQRSRILCWRLLPPDSSQGRTHVTPASNE